MDLLNVKRLVTIVAGLVVVSCGSGGGDAGTAPTTPAPRPNPDMFWSLDIPDFHPNPDAPVVELNGPEVVFLSVDEEYIEYGATAVDAQDGDISDNIEIQNHWNRFSEGDYFVRYQVRDSSGQRSLEKVRLIRVFDEKPVSMMKRPIGRSQSHLGYIESLPENYGENENSKYALLIFNHGNGSNVEVSGNEPSLALDTIIQGAGPALMQSNSKWDTSMPIITLSPQMSGIGDGKEMERFNAFIDYALNTYNIDESRIYVTGWSQGGFLSFLYAATYPERVAAAVSISGGLPFNPDEVPDDICNIESVPLWAFHGKDDGIVSVDSSIRTIDYINQNCQPTVLPKLTVFLEQRHPIHHSVYSLSALENGSQNFIGDQAYDQYDIGIFDWLLQHQNN